jgi:hypothetical protein
MSGERASEGVSTTSNTADQTSRHALAAQSNRDASTRAGRVAILLPYAVFVVVEIAVST